MTQSAVSGRISQMEDRFKVRLLDRSGHRTSVPTPKGLEVYGYAERMLTLKSEMMSQFAGAAELSGTVRIGTAETLVHTLLSVLLRELHRLHPGITPEITVDISPTLHSALLSGELDVAMLLGPLTEPRIHNVPLRDYPLAWVASPGLALSERPGLAELVRWPILSYARRTLPHTQIADLFSRPDLPPARIFASSSLATIVRMAVDGIGIGILPHAVVDRDLEEGRLRLLDVVPVLQPLRFTASYLATPGRGLAEAVASLASKLCRGEMSAADHGPSEDTISNAGRLPIAGKGSGMPE